MSVVKG
ncbi:hypothetical protein Nmel_008981 [Mimus melanotis]